MILILWFFEKFSYIFLRLVRTGVSLVLQWLNKKDKLHLFNLFTLLLLNHYPCFHCLRILFILSFSSSPKLWIISVGFRPKNSSFGYSDRNTSVIIGGLKLGWKSYARRFFCKISFRLWFWAAVRNALGFPSFVPSWKCLLRILVKSLR